MGGQASLLHRYLPHFHSFLAWLLQSTTLHSGTHPSPSARFFLRILKKNKQAYRKFADLRVVIECWTVAWLLLLQLVHRYHNIFLFLIIIVKFKFFISALTLHKRQYVMKNSTLSLTSPYYNTNLSLSLSLSLSVPPPHPPTKQQSTRR